MFIPTNLDPAELQFLTFDSFVALKCKYQFAKQPFVCREKLVVEARLATAQKVWSVLFGLANNN